ncbi:radical SAM protein [Desulfonema magnum]|uniref:Radical SAM domain-containing protein n=1 Tax=Desulfonema magnum TaxID=45655 RepID=A0A975BGQ3_9BACT|nr:radical SAM protein [Desulfonema magnum]QTA85097.1 Radical SAM domain-containing protein [Desulfonema magnum]
MTTKKTVSFSKNSTNIFFHILTRCNLRCQHCYINPVQHGENTLPLSTIAAWLEAFAEKSDRANVIFLGGEPTLHPELSHAIKKARQLNYGSVTVDTNGYLFHDILSKVKPEEVDYFSFSLDGATREMNDKIRGEGSYDKCIAGIRESVSKGFATSLIYTVSKVNLHELEMMVPLVKELGISRFFIQVIGIRGKSADPSAPLQEACDKLQVSREEWLDIIPNVAEKVAEFGIIVTYPKVFLDPEEAFECAGLVADNYFIFPNGRVYRCPLCEDFPLHSLRFEDNQLVRTGKISESDLFELDIPEGCVMNKLIQPENLSYKNDGTAEYKVACCMLKEEILQN